MSYEFYTDHEKQIAEEFLRKKYIIVPAENKSCLNAIQNKMAKVVAQAINQPIPAEGQAETFLNNIHELISVEQLNDLRLKVISEINRDTSFRHSYFRLAQGILQNLVGNEIAMQRRINLSIQLPNDSSSLLPVHADAWAGDSPFEIVLWVPLVNCYSTKSMYFTDSDFDEKLQSDFGQFAGKSSEDIYEVIKDHVKFLDVPFGSVLLFSQNVMHGNRINIEKETRWSMNCRFKSILSPYLGKKMGEFFEPIMVRPLTRVGLTYRLPEAMHGE